MQGRACSATASCYESEKQSAICILRGPPSPPPVRCMAGLGTDCSTWEADLLVSVCSFDENGTKLKLIHRTSTGGIPGALVPFRGQLLAGIGSALRLYEASARHEASCRQEEAAEKGRAPQPGDTHLHAQHSGRPHLCGRPSGALPTHDRAASGRCVLSFGSLLHCS